MALKFNCSHCGNEIVVQYLRTGETAICRHCGLKSEVPTDAQRIDEVPEIKHDNPVQFSEDVRLSSISARMLENIDASQAYSIESPAKTILILIWITIGILTVFSVSGIIRYLLLVKIKNGDLANLSAWGAASDSLDAMISLIYVIAGLGTLIAFFVWFYRAHRNLRYANVPGIRHASGWTIGGFFVPILNLFRPYQMMAETWRGSAAMSGIHDYQEFLQKPANSKVALWWALSILASTASFIGSEAVSYSKSIDGIINGAIFTVIGRIAYALFFIMLIYLVKEITRHQTNARKIALIKSSA